MGRIFWILLIGLTALSTHIGYILFAPKIVFARQLEQQTAAVKKNQFQVLEPASQKQLFPLSPASSVVGICKFDLSAGPVLLNANMPAGFWTLTIYDNSGKEFYNLNDQQSGTLNFSLKLVQAKSAVEQFTGKADAEAEGRNLGWTVETDTTTGVAVVWVPVSEPLMRQAIIAVLGPTACLVEKKS